MWEWLLCAKQIIAQFLESRVKTFEITLHNTFKNFKQCHI